MALTVHNLKLSKGTFRLEVPQLAVPRGRVMGISGASGSGKSSLLEAIAGFVPLESGEIAVEGARIDSLPPERRRVAMMFQRASLFPHLSVAENIGFALRVRGEARAAREARVADWLSRLQIGDLGGRAIDEISGGQAQRVALGRALITGFPVLLLDEPFAALDGALRRELRAFLKELVVESQVAALLVSHDVDDFTDLASEVRRMENGRLL